MRSRYTAYVRGAVDYLVETDSKPSDRAAIAKRSRETIWRGLEIVSSEPGDTESFVEFIARGEVGGTPFMQRERSRFVRKNGRWIYVDAVAPGRNDPCPCGSGQKYKRCHGASR
jgi:SEC-C motif-containing protein